MRKQKLLGIALVGASMQIATAAPFAYLPQPEANKVAVFDLATDKNRSKSADELITTLTVQTRPVAATPNRNGTYVYVVNSGSNSISVIDSSTNNVVQHIPVGSKPVAAQVSRDDKKLYVANNGENTISVIDTQTGQLLKKLPADAPSTLLMTKTGRLYVSGTSSNSVQAFDTRTDEPIFTIDAGASPIAINNAGDDLVYIAVAGSKIRTWSVKDVNKISQGTEITVRNGSGNVPRQIKAMTMYEPIQKLYIAMDDGSILLLDTQNADNTQTSQQQEIKTTLKQPSGIQMAPGFAHVVLTDAGSNSIATIATDDNAVKYKMVNAPTTATGNFISAPSFQIEHPSYIKEEDNNTYISGILTVTVKREGNISGFGRVNYLTESRTAFTKWDFLESKGELEFAPGETSKQISIQIIGDQSVEPDEDFVVRLDTTRDGHVTGVQNTAQITIINDDKDPKGCTVGGQGPLDPILPTLTISALAYTIFRRKICQPK